MGKRTHGRMQIIAKTGKGFVGLFTPPTLAVLGGAALTAWGLWMIDPALSAITCGVSLTAFGLWLAGVDVPWGSE